MIESSNTDGLFLGEASVKTMFLLCNVLVGNVAKNDGNWFSTCKALSCSFLSDSQPETKETRYITGCLFWTKRHTQQYISSLLD